MSRFTLKLSIDINNAIQADIFDRIIDSDWLALSRYNNGDVLNRFNSDVGTVSGNAISWLPSIIIAFYHFIATFFIILHYDVFMAIVEKVGKDRFSELNSVWHAHKLRNQIAHDNNFQPDYKQAKNALATYKQALKDLGAI